MSYLLDAPTKRYKPFRYPQFEEYWRIQQRMHWIPEEIPLHDDVKDWKTLLSMKDKNLLTQLFRFFTQADVEVQDCYHRQYSSVFKPTEVVMMLTAFSNMETVHMVAYSYLLDTLGLPESEYSAFLEIESMKASHDYMSTFGVKSEKDIARTLAMFGGFTEGVKLFATFAMLMNYPRHNRMKGMGQIVTYSVRDESLHCEGIIALFHALCAETGCLTQDVKQDIMDCCETVVRLEDSFIDLAFEMGDVEGMTAPEIKKYIRFVANWRLKQLGLPKMFQGVDHHPLPWLAYLLNGVEFSNFFEQKATEYTKGSTQGTWEDAYASLDLLLLNRKNPEIVLPNSTAGGLATPSLMLP